MSRRLVNAKNETLRLLSTDIWLGFNMCFGQVPKKKKTNNHDHELSTLTIQPLGGYQYDVLRLNDGRHPLQARPMSLFEISYRNPQTASGDNVIAQFGVWEDNTEL